MIKHIALYFVLILSSFARAESIKIGVPLALSGEAVTFGTDMRNALTLVNEKFGEGRYELIFEDEKCTSKDAVSVAHKLVDVDKVKYALGFPCNSTLLSTAPIYERAGVLTVTSSATSGDILDIGKNIFRLFPADNGCIETLYPHVTSKHHKIAIITEQDEYPLMMERTFDSLNKNNKTPIELIHLEFLHGTTDMRTLAAKIKFGGSDAIMINANTDSSFITLVKQLKAEGITIPIYSAYLPASAAVREALGANLEGFEFCNLPPMDDLVTPKGRDLVKEFRDRFGEPQSGFPVVLTSFEAFRILDLALKSGADPVKFLSSQKFSDGFLPEYRFDEHGAVQGIHFEMQKIEGGKVRRLVD